MKDYTIRRYSFEELSERAKEKAIEGMRNSLNELLDSEALTEYLEERVSTALGGESERIRLEYSLSYCQGDGVAIYGTIQRKDAPDLSWPEGAAYVELGRTQWSNHYSHYNSFSVSAYDEEGEDIEDVRIIETQLRDLCRELERDGYKFIEACTSEEAAIEQLQEAGDVFTIDGKWSVPAGIIEEVSK